VNGVRHRYDKLDDLPQFVLDKDRPKFWTFFFKPVQFFFNYSVAKFNVQTSEWTEVSNYC
jgi:hypothetical protein